MKNRSLLASAVLGITIGLGIAFAGYRIGDALYKIKAGQRYVSVKGLAEKEVSADLVIWPLAFVETDNDLARLQQKVNRDYSIIRDFLLNQGFTGKEIYKTPPVITDYQSMGYVKKNMPAYRYKAGASILLRSEKVKLAIQSMGRSDTLVKKGVALVRDYNHRTEFLFTSLNKIKPGMIAEATRGARKAAEQFARDSGSKVGAIRRARQGFFTIRNRDASSPYYKKVRVVTTVEYFLIDK